MKNKTTDDFIQKAKKIHGDKYDYSKVEYINSKEKVCIICPEHGEFWQRANDHLCGCGCKKCFNNIRGKSKLLTTEDFIKRAKQVHGDRYDYSKVKYINIINKVCIICPEHGEFWQSPNEHLSGKKCKFCAHRSFKKNTEEFIKEAKKIHGDKYDYSKVEYINNKTKVCIICPEHGEFWQTPKSHLNGSNCKKCSNKKSGNKNKITTEEFIKRAKKIHGDKYDYSKVEYIDTDTKVCIICPEHGEFWQTPHNHIGQKQGCPFCMESHLEKEIKEFLEEKKIKYEQQKKFNWLRYKKPLKLDFYLPGYNIAIECQGEQHFNKFRWEKDEKLLNERKKRDEIKKELCEKNNIKLVFYSFKKFNENIITDKNKLLCV